MLLVIFDLNGTLVDFYHRQDVVLRPYIGTLLRTLHDLDSRGLIRFAVWSSSERSKVMKIVRAIFPRHMLERMLFQYDGSRCEIGYKNLRTTIWGAFPEFSEENTVIVDDSLEKIHYSQRRCLHLVPTFNAARDMPTDTALLVVQRFLAFRGMTLARSAEHSNDEQAENRSDDAPLAVALPDDVCDNVV